MGPPISPNHAMRRGTRPDLYVKWPRISPFPHGTMKPGPNRNVKSLSAASETARLAASGQFDGAAGSEHEDEPGRDEDALDHSSCDISIARVSF